MYPRKILVQRPPTLLGRGRRGDLRRLCCTHIGGGATHPEVRRSCTPCCRRATCALIPTLWRHIKDEGYVSGDPRSDLVLTGLEGHGEPGDKASYIRGPTGGRLRISVVCQGTQKMTWFLPAWRGSENQGNKASYIRETIGGLRISGDPQGEGFVCQGTQKMTWFLPASRGSENQGNKASYIRGPTGGRLRISGDPKDDLVLTGLEGLGGPVG